MHEDAAADAAQDAARDAAQDAADRALSQGFIVGEAAAVQALIHRHTPRLRALLARRSCPHQDRDDIVQRAWLRALAARSRLDPSRPFAPWIAQITTRLWWDDLRRQRTRTLAGQTSGHGTEVWDAPAPSCCSSPSGIDHLERQDLHRALAALPADQRQAILLTQFEGLTMREASAFCGTGVSGVKSRVSRGYAALRGLINDPSTRPPLPSRRHIQVEVSGCERCVEVLALVGSIACPTCTVEVQQVRQVQGVGPRLLVDGQLIAGLEGALAYRGTLRALGVGLCAGS